MFFLIPVALFALCLVHGIVRAVQDVRWERRVYWDDWTDKARAAFQRMALEDLESMIGLSPFRHHWNDRPVTTAAADNRQGISLFSLVVPPPEWVDSRGNPQPFKSIVPDHLRGSMELILDRPPREEVDWVVTRAAFKITKHDPEPRAFLLKDIVT